MLKEKSVAFYTLGCKVNYSETSYISKVFEEHNFVIKKFNEFADIYIINTCSVTHTAVKKSRNIIQKAIRQNPDSLVVVTGCITETEKNEIESIQGIGLIVGANEKFSLFEKVSEKITLFNIDKQIFEETTDKSENSFFSTYSSGERTRSFLKIQDGCNYFCSYCVIPYARGRSRSDTIENILKNVSKIIASGVKEIIITGINIGDFRSCKDEKLIDLLMALENTEGLNRVRLSSIEPDLLTDEIIELFSKSKILLPHFHIPLQSGSDKILKLMNRKYDTAFFKDKIEKIKSVLPDSCIATDIITAFPLETDVDFNNTLSFLENINLSYFHVFSYSLRRQTKAAQFDTQISPDVKKVRTESLLKLSDLKKEAFYNSQKGKNHTILFESSKVNGYMHGFTQNYLKVKMPYNKLFVNKIVTSTLIRLDSDNVFVVDQGFKIVI